MNQTMAYVVSGLIAYCLGSISMGLLVARLANGPDLRSVGSKNTGASNVLRTMGWKYGLITFFGDFLKAVLACWIGRLLTGAQEGALLCGLLVILGHNWPVFFGFRGGKGVASSCGVMLFCFPVPALICFGVAIGIIAVTKFISLGSMCMLTSYAILVSCFRAEGRWLVIAWAVILAALCILRHRGNIVRLIRGTENRFGQRIQTGNAGTDSGSGRERKE